MFKVFKKGAVLEHQVKKDIAPLSARKILKGKIRYEKSKVDGTADFSYGMDKREARKNLKQWQNDYDRTCPENLPAEAKNIMWKRAKALKDHFTMGMLSKDEMHPVKQFEVNGAIKTVINEEVMRSTNAVRRNVAWETRNQPVIREYKNIMRHLCPDNPAATDIEKFRPVGRIK